MSGVKCKTCGSLKKHHSKYLWEAHQKMHEGYKRALKETERQRKAAQK